MCSEKKTSTTMYPSSLLFPHEVVGSNVIEGKSMIRAWREYRKITQFVRGSIGYKNKKGYRIISL